MTTTSADLQNLYSQYLMIEQAYYQAVKEYALEAQSNVNKSVTLTIENTSDLTFYVGRYNNLSFYYDISNNIETINVNNGLLVTLYTDTSFNGNSVVYIDNSSNTTQNVNAPYQSMIVEILDTSYNTYAGKIFQSTASPTIQSNITSLSDCANACLNTACNAAVFDSCMNACSIYNYPGLLQSGTSADTTIIPNNYRQLLIVTQLNQQLQDIMARIKSATISLIQADQISEGEKSIALAQFNANKFKMEQLETTLKQQEAEFNNLEEQYNNSTTFVNQNSIWNTIIYTVLFILIFVVVKMIFIPEKKSDPTNIFIIIFIILASFNLSNIYGYLLFLILVLILILRIILPRL